MDDIYKDLHSGKITKVKYINLYIASEIAESKSNSSGIENIPYLCPKCLYLHIDESDKVKNWFNDLSFLTGEEYNTYYDVYGDYEENSKKQLKIKVKNLLKNFFKYEI